MDWMAQERERGITICAAATTCFWSPGEYLTKQKTDEYHLISLIPLAILILPLKFNDRCVF